MEEEQNSGTLDGTTEPTVVDAGRVFVNTGPEFPVQKNGAAKVIGILTIIFGVFAILNGLLSLTDWLMTDINGFPITTPIEYKISRLIFSLAAGSMMIVGGYKMTNYEKMGIWIIFVAFAVNYVGGFISSVLMGDAQGEGMGFFNASVGGICGIFCIAICGVIVAIPLMLADGGME
jgi:peptidoglycan/LPS O-acetylase OafA/YrhL|tara:strand:+ start:66 stop:593 length:528 start_codon:yes stop_codon:yes gene_type:complete